MANTLPSFELDLNLQSGPIHEVHLQHFLVAFDQYKRVIQAKDTSLSEEEFTHIRHVIENWIHVSYEMAQDRDEGEPETYSIVLGFPKFTVVAKVRYV